MKNIWSAAKILFLLGLSLFSCTQTGTKTGATPAEKQPNIIFILADDLGYGDLGCYGQQAIKTPHLDQMSAQGLLFTQFYAGATVCAPSRAALMTGLHTGHASIRGNKGTKPEGQWPLPASDVTVATVLQEAGYTTGAFGKWGLGYITTSGSPDKKGFEQFFGYNCQSQAHNFYPDHLWRNTERISYPNTPENQQVYAAEEIHKNALAFIDENKDRPFFLFLPYTLPHAALQVPEDTLFESYKSQFEEQPMAIPATWDSIKFQPQAYPRAAYATMVSRLDTYVGEVLAKLKALGLDQNTLVVFTSDNGPHQEGGHNPAFFNSSGGLRGIKRDLYEGGIRMPTIAYWPGKVRAGSQSDHIGAFWDFMPTFAAMAGANAPAHTDGISLLPTLLGQGDQGQHPYLYWEFHELGGKQAVRMGKWKGVKLNVMANPQSPLELYDLEKDRAEHTDVAASHPEVVARLSQILAQARTENQEFPFSSTTKLGKN